MELGDGEVSKRGNIAGLSERQRARPPALKQWAHSGLASHRKGSGRRSVQEGSLCPGGPGL